MRAIFKTIGYSGAELSELSIGNIAAKARMTYGLTDREEEVLALLLEGRTRMDV